VKILLLGEFSALHKNLKEGLVELGHDVTIASSGDGWKNIDSDITIGSTRKGLIGKFLRIINLIKIVPKLRGYDVVQFINPVMFPLFLGINKAVVKYIFKNNNKVFLVAAGATNSITAIADFCESNYKYPDLYNEIKKINPAMWSQTREGREYNTFFLENVDGVIPIMYEYAQGFRDIKYEKLCSTIAIPMNIENIKYEENKVTDKIIFFHGLNREGIKGTPLIRQAMDKLKENYPDDVECIIDGRMSLKKYLSFLKKINVVIDQVYSVSTGVNGVYNLALGKIIIGGGEKEYLTEFGLTSSPLIPINASVDDIYNQLEWVVQNKERIPELSYASRALAEKLHDYKKIAQEYLSAWNEKK
jgi:glycosyltransferase involved in cell wall biosynthesis